MRYTTQSEAETKRIATDLASVLEPGTVLCLHGNLGAGKTTFVKGLAAGFGITEEIKSPTFTLMNLYKVKKAKNGIRQLAHIDTYRLKDEHELLSIGVADFLGEPNTLVVVEWPEKITPILRGVPAKNIFFEHTTEKTCTMTIED